MNDLRRFRRPCAGYPILTNSLGFPYERLAVSPFHCFVVTEPAMRSLHCLPLAAVGLLLVLSDASAQSQAGDVEQLKQMVLDLQRRVSTLEEENRQLQIAVTGRTGANAMAAMPDADPQTAAALGSATAALRSTGAAVSAANSPDPLQTSPQTSTEASTPTTSPASLLPGTLPGGATLNYYFDGYYEYNFNDPVGRVNDLRAYDVLSNTFSINQADIIFDWEPDLAAHRRYGFRTDFQFGQATETLQGNPANEPRPEIYRNIFQAYGSYIVPAGRGVRVDVGKWASSLGIEGNYTKDQMNYTRSWYFNFLPFYHQGAKVNYQFNDKLGVNYWIVNGTNQSEPTNGYKDEMFGLAVQPVKAVSWTINYYIGQEHPNTVPAADCTVPVQPGLCELPIIPAPNGKIHIFDSYATWQATPKLTLAGEADYMIEREWANAAPGESSAPSHVDGGAAYAQYQVTRKIALAARSEYLSDRGGLFSDKTQALKEVTGTYKYNFADGFDAFLEYRRDWTNIPYFVTNNPASPTNHQDTATMGLVWWYGGKQGAW
jgi:hypothetical protein